MTVFEIISIFIGILALLIAFGSFVIALLAKTENITLGNLRISMPQ